MNHIRHMKSVLWVKSGTFQQAECYNLMMTEAVVQKKEGCSMSKKDELIKRISEASNDGDLPLDFMNQYKLDNLMTATEEQLSQYVTDNRL